MRNRIPAVCTLILLTLFTVANAQRGEVALGRPVAKIATVASMRVRRSPQAAAPEVTRLRLGTVVNAAARTADRETVGTMNDYWYRINLPNGSAGWAFGGLLMDYDPQQRLPIIRRIVEKRRAAENTAFQDRGELYAFLSDTLLNEKNPAARAEYEFLRLLAFRDWASAIPDDQASRSPYREWLKTHASEVMRNEFGGGYDVKTDLFWKLASKYSSLPIGEKIAWEATQNEEPSDCESDEACAYFVFGSRLSKYLGLHPNGAHAAEAVSTLSDMVTDDVIRTATGSGGDKYAVQARAQMRTELMALRTALGKTSAPGRDALLRKLEKVR